MKAIAVNEVEALLEKWKSETGRYMEERATLAAAAEIIKDGSLKNNIDLWDMRTLRLQRCILDMQMLLFAAFETPNADLTGATAPRIGK